MARINKSTVGGKLVNDLIRGFGLRGGRKGFDLAEKYVASKTLQMQSKYRKQIDRFTLTGDFQKDLKKVLSLIEQFNEEYSTTQAMFQKDFYLEGDINFIDGKLEFIHGMIMTDDEDLSFERILRTWTNYRNKFK